ncbi:MAG: hypothetical protein U1F71_18660 [Verrucomicrobiaceae bacterium]
MKFLLGLAATIVFSSCSISVTAIPVSGPSKGAGAMVAKFIWANSNSGKVTATMPWGEKCSGRYATGNASGSMAWKVGEMQFSKVSESTFGEFESRVASMGNVHVGKALLIGEQGTVVDVIYAATSMTHGFGEAKDSRGNFYKIIF